ncbi:thymidine kinase [bacterium]|nr:thymidine kinase [bacterium]
MARGRLEVVTGCMFSGKTGELIRRLERAAIAGLSVACYKPQLDDRYSPDKAVTHYGRSFPAVALPKTISEVMEMGGDWEESSVVAIDEGNLFDEGLVSLVLSLVERGKRVIVSGLDQDFTGAPFAPMPSLMARADSLLKLTAVCTKCGRDATRTQRLVKGRPARPDDPLIQVGGTEAYEARCPDHHDVPSDE